jgi:hypothetical protein
MPFEDVKDNIREIRENSEKYAESTIKLVKLWLFKVFAKSVSLFIKFIFVLLFVVFCLIFLSVSLALFLSDITGSYVYGFLIVSGIYAILIILLIYLKPVFIDKLILRNLSEIIFDD